MREVLIHNMVKNLAQGKIAKAHAKIRHFMYYDKSHLYTVIVRLIDENTDFDTLETILGLQVKDSEPLIYFNTDNDFETLVHKAIKDDRPDILDRLLASKHCSSDLLKKADVDKTALHLAALHDSTECFHILLTSEKYRDETLLLHKGYTGKTAFEMLFEKSSLLPFPLDVLMNYFESCEPELLEKILFTTEHSYFSPSYTYPAIDLAIEYDRKLHKNARFNPSMFDWKDVPNPPGQTMTVNHFFDQKGLKSKFLPRLVEICANKGIITFWMRYRLFMNGYFSLAFTSNRYGSPITPVKAVSSKNAGRSSMATPNGINPKQPEVDARLGMQG